LFVEMETLPHEGQSSIGLSLVGGLEGTVNTVELDVVGERLLADQDSARSIA
jgi:hypothetical protein